MEDRRSMTELGEGRLRSLWPRWFAKRRPGPAGPERPPAFASGREWLPETMGEPFGPARTLDVPEGEAVVEPRTAGLTVRFKPDLATETHARFRIAVVDPALLPAHGRLLLRCRARVLHDAREPGVEASLVLGWESLAGGAEDGGSYGCRTGSVWRTLSLRLDVNTDGPVALFLRVPARTNLPLEIRGLHLIGCEPAPRWLVPSLDPAVRETGPCDLGKVWAHSDGELTITFLGERFYLGMPRGWTLDDVDDRGRTVVEDYFFGDIESELFGIPRLLGTELAAAEPIEAKHETILSFSTGHDSTATLCLLPEGTPLYYCERDYDHFFTHRGKRVELGWRVAEKHALNKVPRCIRVPNDLELLQIKFGGRFGYPSRQSCVAVGVLLCRFVSAATIAIGSPLETTFLQNGYTFVDIVAARRSSYQRFRDLLRYCGLDIAYPIGGLSEVVTSRIVDIHEGTYYAVSCPNVDEDFRPCGVCYKCFRKLRLRGESAPPPDAKTEAWLSKRPLKMGSSTLYAAQVSGFRHPGLDPYGELDLDFLNRYLSYGIDTLNPTGLRKCIKEKLESWGIRPMSTEDERKLRLIGESIYPEGHQHSRAFGTDDRDRPERGA